MFATAGAVCSVLLSSTCVEKLRGFALRLLFSPCPPDTVGVGDASEVEIVKPGFAADRAQAAPQEESMALEPGWMMISAHKGLFSAVAHVELESLGGLEASRRVVRVCCSAGE